MKWFSFPAKIVREFLAESLFMISKYEERVKIFKDAEKDKKEEVITVDDDDDVKDDPFPPAAWHSSAPTAGSVSSPVSWYIDNIVVKTGSPLTSYMSL